ncbi:hypothetical protein PDE_08680 [Penicillium oxalicum 114-2]|uniref:Uncharacterized protein n=1 Tax=Penicillium oxalicum (strain 114-2 / CGMCC 5302) TaxID=933388 RepID=S8B4E5_PENO1|nr:hypothetical protein PDE_08680 [Penicillium oxalicum 114-2]
MPSLQHLHPEYCHRSRNGFYTFPSSFHGRHIHQVLVNGRNGSIHTVQSHHVKCSSPTTPPAERRAYAAREQERKAKRHSTSSEDSDSSNSTPSSIRHAHGRRGHGRYDPTLKAKRPTSANKIPPKHSQKAHKSAEISDRQDSDTDSSYSTTAHVPRPRRHPYISHHHQSHQHHHRHRHYEAPPEHYVVKVPFPTHCPDCCQTVVPPTPDALPATKIRTQPSVETSRENLKKAKHCSSNCAHGCENPPSSSMAQVTCHCGFVHVDPAQGHPSRKTARGDQSRGYRGPPSEPEQGPHSRRRQHGRYRKHRRHDSRVSSDTAPSERDESGSESSMEARVGRDKHVSRVPPDDWEFCSGHCCGHPVFYIVR